MSHSPPLQHPGLHVQSMTARSRSVSPEGSISASVPTVGRSAPSGSAAESMLPSVSSVSLTTMPSIIVLHTGPPCTSPPQVAFPHEFTPSSHMPSLRSVHVTPAQSIRIAPASSITRHSSVRSTMTVESNINYTSADSEPSPFIPVDFPEAEIEYELTYSGLEDTRSIVSGTTARRGYNFEGQYPATRSLPTADSESTETIHK
ncbi:hypothetical protein FRC11_006733 [Ceratobasidium sp. 423]|nr:hypothetical protein FRC11_006733 [Ceratobasidium sp. 423]